MKIHRRLIVLVGLGMLLILSITVLSLQDISGAFSRTTKELALSSLEYEKIWDVEKEAADMSLALHNFVETGDEAYRTSYAAAVTDARQTLSDIASLNLDQKEMSVIASLIADLHEIEKQADRILSLRAPASENRAFAQNLLAGLDGLFIKLGKDIVQYQNAHAAQMGMIMRGIRDNKVRTNILFIMILCTSAGFLLAFGLYIHRKVSAPLNDLWVGTEEISRGNLDYQMQLRGDGDIARLGERFNEMAQKLQGSYADLERKLLDRTRELAALDSVALTLSHAGTLRDVLNKSLLKILDSLSGIEPKGGVFLCDPDGDVMRLTAQQGLEPEFVQREETIKIGECLCGMVAQTGEMLFTEQGCDDPRHTRLPGEKGHSHIIIPMKSRGVVLGIIFLYPKRGFTLKPSDVQMLEAIGVQLGMAVENFRFYAEVKESSEKYWDLFENSRDILFTMDTEGRLTAVNKAAEKFSGYSKVELAGKSVLGFLMPEGAEAAKRVLADEHKSANRMMEFEVVKKDGSRAFIEVSARKLFRGRQAAGFQVSARDVTEQKNLREMLVKAERLGAIGQVGIAVRHEINNPLTTIIGNTELLIERYENADIDLRARLDMILNNALRIAEIVKRLEGIKQEKVVEYLKGVKMTDLKQG
jgi:PAS domain S-box-containing protein